MAEKGDLPSDQVSLPPTYAPSETYTESPPPAYKRSGMAAVKVARIVCVTLLVMTFLIGCAVVGHKWIQLKECDCSLKPETAPHSLPLVAAFGKGPNDLQEFKDEPETNEDTNPFDENENQENDINLEADEEIKEMKKLQLPIDMLLGNPSLAGKNIPCNVEKRRQKIADGIFTEAVIVTCENEEKIDLPFFPMSQPNQASPPLSLISHIMKALASRQKSDIADQVDVGEPNRFIRKPFPFGNPMPFPINEIKSRSFPFGPGKIHITPIKINGMNKPQAIPNMRDIPPPFPFPMPRPLIKRISIRPMHLDNKIMQHERSQPIIRQMPTINIPHMPEENFNTVPFGGAPIKIIKIQANEPNMLMNRHPFPLTTNPIMKFSPIGKAKILRVMPQPIADHDADYSEGEENINEFQRPIEIIDHNEDNFEEFVPEASGRSLPSPRVDLPGIRFFRLPNQPPLMRFPDTKIMTHMELRKPLLDENQDFPDTFSPLFETQGEEFGPPRTHTVIKTAPEPIFRSEQSAIPHVHLDEQDELINVPQFLPQAEPISLPQLQPRFFAPPPPRFAREGRFSPFAEINPEAEIYTGPNGDQPNNHHVILN